MSISVNSNPFIHLLDDRSDDDPDEGAQIKLPTLVVPKVVKTSAPMKKVEPQKRPTVVVNEPAKEVAYVSDPDQSTMVKENRHPSQRGTRRRGRGGHPLSPSGEIRNSNRSTTPQRSSLKKEVSGKATWGDPIESQKVQTTSDEPEEDQGDAETPKGSLRVHEQRTEPKAPLLMTLDQYISSTMKSEPSTGAPETQQKTKGIYINSDSSDLAEIVTHGKVKIEDTLQEPKKRQTVSKPHAQKNVIELDDGSTASQGPNYYSTRGGRGVRQPARGYRRYNSNPDSRRREGGHYDSNRNQNVEKQKPENTVTPQADQKTRSEVFAKEFPSL